MSITNNLNFIGRVDKEFFMKNGGRIIGTNESDLLQEYRSVKLRGNLRLKNLYLKPNTILHIGDEDIEYNFPNIYWTKSNDQVGKLCNT